MKQQHVLPGRAALVDELDARLTDRHAAPAGTSLLIVSLDSFRQVNDGLGRDAGDGALEAIGTRLGEVGSPSEAVFRLDGDEFALVCASMTRSEALELAEHAMDAVRKPLELTGSTVRLSASIGVANAEAGTTGIEMLRAADATTSFARTHGAGFVEVFEPPVLESAVYRLEVTADLAAALANETGLLLHYQPVVDLETGRIVGAEALVRWQHPERGLVPPDAFISIAEETGLISQLGSWVLDTAVGQLAEWEPMVGEDFRMHVNLSPIEMRHPGFMDRVAASLARHDVPAGKLLLEITETELMTAGSEPMKLLRDLKDVGVDLGIDDFGTGYSSISYLSDLPVDMVKLDRSLISGVSTSPQQYDLARSIFGLMKSAELQVVAEGIETNVQVAHLRSLHCRFGQGFFLGRPTEADKFKVQFLQGRPV